MSSRRDDDEPREMIQRIEREFGARASQAQGAPRHPPQEAPVGDQGGPGFRPAEPFRPQPVRLSLPLSRPRAVYVVLGLNVLLYAVTVLLTTSLEGSEVPRGFDAFTYVLYRLGAKYNPAIDRGEYWRFLTPIVLHGGLLHLGLNTYALYSLGPESERVFGTGRFLAIYLLAGFGGTIASYMRSTGLSIGASGAIFGLIGALAAFFYSARSLLGSEQARQQIIQLGTLAALNILIGMSSRAIDNAAHVGGLVAGAAAGLALAPHYRIDDRLYPPAVVRADRAPARWLMAGGILLILVTIAAYAVGQN